MKTSTWAKVAGWLQFAVVTAGQVFNGFAHSGTPTSPWSWITLVSSLATAVAVHGAASTGGEQ